MRRPLLLFAAMAAGHASASTDCTSTVAKLMIETAGKGSYTVTLGSGVAFVMKADAGAYREVLAVAQMTLVTGGALVARFAASDASCTTGTPRSDLVAIAQGDPRDIATTTTTTPPSPMPSSPSTQSIVLSSSMSAEAVPEPELTSRSIPEMQPTPCDVNALGPVRDRALQQAVRVDTKDKISALATRLEQLLTNRKALDDELGFYAGRQHLPRSLRRTLEDSNHDIVRVRAEMNRYGCFLAQVEAQR